MYKFLITFKRYVVIKNGISQKRYNYVIPKFQSFNLNFFFTNKINN